MLTQPAVTPWAAVWTNWQSQSVCQVDPGIMKQYAALYIVQVVKGSV